MDIKYLKLRLQTFRREYFELTGNWFNQKFSWLWQFTIDNFKFLYRGEIHQIKYLTAIINQQKEYINNIQSSGNQPASSFTDNSYDSNIEKFILSTIKIFLIPVSFIIYWIRRFIRIVKRQHFNLAISENIPTEDMFLDPSYIGESHIVYLNNTKYERYPRGLVMFSYHLTVSKGDAEPVLYIDPGSGFSDNFSIPLPVNNKSTYQECLLELPPHCKRLKLKISNKNIEFKLDDVIIRELNFFTAAWHLKLNNKFGINEILHALFIRKMPGVRRPESYRSTYQQWYQCYGKLSNDDKTAITRHIDTFTSSPIINIIIKLDKSAPSLIKTSLNSVVNQLYKNWELLILCDCEPDAHLTSVINYFERSNKNIKIIIDRSTSKISSNINHAIELMHDGYTIFLEPTDVLTSHALYLFALQTINKNDLKLIYSDHDQIDNYGILDNPAFKSDWNYDLFLGKNYIKYLSCYETSLLKTIFAESDKDNFNIYDDLSLLFVEKISSNEIAHIPYVLLHHRNLENDINYNKDLEVLHNDNSLTSHLNRTDQNASAIKSEYGHWIKRNPPSPDPLISLIVLTRDRVALLSNCINGLLNHTDYNNIEIIIIDNGSQEESTLTYLESLESHSTIKIIRDDSEFNFSELNNIALNYATGDYIGLINNDISVIKPHWLTEMMGHLCREDVGIVGAKLLYEDNTIQHAGVTIGLGGVAGHSFRYSPQHYRGYDDRLILCHEVSCVTAACLLTKKSIYKEVSGLNAVNLRVAFNDVDYCLKVRQKGYKVIWTPFAELYHLESASRGSDLSRDNIHRWNSEYTYMRDNWDEVLDKDPFYNPNLTITDEDFSLAIPPRLVHPWSKYTYLEK